GQVSGEPRVIDAFRPGGDPGVGLDPQAAEFGKILDHPGAVLEGDGRPGPAVEARHPDLVAPQEMRQGAVDRVPEGAARPPSFGVGEATGGGKNPAVHLGIVGRHGAHEFWPDACRAGRYGFHDRHTPTLSMSRVVPRRAATSRRIGPSRTEPTGASVSAGPASR